MTDSFTPALDILTMSLKPEERPFCAGAGTVMSAVVTFGLEYWALEGAALTSASPKIKEVIGRKRFVFILRLAAFGQNSWCQHLQDIRRRRFLNHSTVKIYGIHFVASCKARLGGNDRFVRRIGVAVGYKNHELHMASS